MPEYTFTGMADEKSFVKADFDRHIEDNQQGAVKFNAKNDFTNDLTEEAAAFLIEQGEPFVLTSEHQAAQQAKIDQANAETKEAPDDADDGKATGSTADATAGTAAGATKATGRTTKASAGTTTTT